MATSMASAAEVAYTAGGMAEGLRADGRGCEEFRTPDIELGVIQQATGSARFKMGGTDVLVAVKVPELHALSFPGSWLLSTLSKRVNLFAFIKEKYISEKLLAAFSSTPSFTLCYD
jgi:hypothetical protein